MVLFTPIGDHYDLGRSFTYQPGTTLPGHDWNNEILCILRNITGAPIIVSPDVYIMDTITGTRLPTVIREDGVHALAVDTEISIDNATLKINNLFVASTDGLVAGAQYMWLLAAAISDNYTPPVQLLQTQNFLMGYENVGADWYRVRVNNAGELIVALASGSTDVWFNNYAYPSAEQALFSNSANYAFYTGTNQALPYEWLTPGGSYAENTLALPRINFNYAFDGLNSWLRLRESGNDSDNKTVITDGASESNSFLHGFDNTNWDRLRATGTNADANAGNTLGTLNVLNFNMTWDDGTSQWDRLRSTNNGADAVAGSTLGVLNSNSFLMGYNGATFDRVRSGATNADGVALSTLGNLNTLGFSYIYDLNTTTWFREYGLDTASDGIAVQTGGIAMSLSHLVGYNQTAGTWFRLRASGNNADNVTPITNGVLDINSHLMGFDGTNWDRVKVNGAGELIVSTTGGGTSVQLIRNDYTGTPVTTAAYVQLTAATSGAITTLEIFDSSGQTLVLATGAAAAEVDQIYIMPGGNGKVNLDISAGTRLSVKAVSANATVGELTINCFA